MANDVRGVLLASKANKADVGFLIGKTEGGFLADEDKARGELLPKRPNSLLVSDLRWPLYQ